MTAEIFNILKKFFFLAHPKAAEITSRWKEPIMDQQLRTDFIKLLGHIRYTPIVSQPRAVIPAGYCLQKLNASGDGSKS